MYHLRQPRPTDARTGTTRVRTVIVIAALTLLGAATFAALAGVIIMRAGWYDVGAITQHWQASYTAMEWTMRYSVRHHARDIVAPPSTPAQLLRGAAVYQARCLQCHGAPGVAPDGIGLSMQPQPGPLVNMMQRWTPAEVYWIVVNGVKMSGMPAWRHRLSDDDIWAVTSFVGHLPALSVRDYAAMVDAARDAAPVAAHPTAPDDHPYQQTAVSAARGRATISQYACQSCHRIPGIVGAQVMVGPPLDRYNTRLYIAGHLPNTRDNLVRWLRAPEQVKVGTTMPNLAVSARDAADIAAYLLSEH